HANADCDRHDFDERPHLLVSLAFPFSQLLALRLDFVRAALLAHLTRAAWFAPAVRPLSSRGDLGHPEELDDRRVTDLDQRIQSPRPKRDQRVGYVSRSGAGTAGRIGRLPTR